MPEVNEAIPAWRNAYKAKQSALKESYYQARKPHIFIHQYTRFVDRLLSEIWDSYAFNEAIALIAVGGYGRQALYPYSDIDLLILTPDSLSEAENQKIAQFISVLWDIGFDVGHSVRDLAACKSIAATDVSTLTNMIEARLITGCEASFTALQAAVNTIIDPKLFLADKQLEQVQRHAKYNQTAYSLEPNLKESPGGLRDLHTVLWIAGGMGLGNDWTALTESGVISARERTQVLRHERYLAALRIRLHFLAKRHEDRLLFDFQNALAAELGFVTNDKKRASEQLMTRYYQSVRFITVFNERLLKTFAEMLGDNTPPEKVINEQFSIKNNLLVANQADLLATEPSYIFKSFLAYQQNPSIKGFSAALIQDLMAAKKHINRPFRHDARNKALFLEILSQPNGINRVLRSMNRYGVLGPYIPAFHRIIGQMQHDLFHIYTVDEHILNVLENVRRFAKPELKHEFPLCHELFTDFDKPHLLYLGALFHDIAKGRGGDHSELGAVDARKFCKSHGLNTEDTELVAWLVDSHLKLSSTAQKTDLSDPEVIHQFAELMQTEYRLTALYLLTVADVRGTSPNVWNAWKARLFETLFYKTREALRSEHASVDDKIAQRKENAKAKLLSFDISDQSIDALWAQLGEAYFIRFGTKQIAWHSRLLMPHMHTQEAIVRAHLSPNGDGIEVMVYAPDQNDLFARICHFFGNMQYNIAQAIIYTTPNGYVLDHFLVLEQETKQISYSGLLKHIETQLTEILSAKANFNSPVTGRVDRQVKHMPIDTQVTIKPTPDTQQHQIDIVVSDNPGLLANIAQILLAHNVALHNAKINTLGNRVEDSFIVSGRNQKTLTEAQILALKTALEAL